MKTLKARRPDLPFTLGDADLPAEIVCAVELNETDAEAIFRFLAVHRWIAGPWQRPNRWPAEVAA